jgi:hypothetical protein
LSPALCALVTEACSAAIWACVAGALGEAGAEAGLAAGLEVGPAVWAIAGGKPANANQAIAARNREEMRVRNDREQFIGFDCKREFPQQDQLFASSLPVGLQSNPRQ